LRLEEFTVTEGIVVTAGLGHGRVVQRVIQLGARTTVESLFFVTTMS
jgi:hypothetical protein